MPVCVWIHGGGFVTGSSSTVFYGPDLIVEKDVIMVSFNYRLGIFGFLSLKDPKLGIPGNAGLKDQTMALKWIKENISFFGGDPNNITIFGESAGSGSVHYQLISNLSKGLFKKAVAMSGTGEFGNIVQPCSIIRQSYMGSLLLFFLLINSSESMGHSTCCLSGVSETFSYRTRIDRK